MSAPVPHDQAATRTRRPDEPDAWVDHDADDCVMRCNRCGTVSPFDPTLPYVKQVAAFTTGHACVIVLPRQRS